MKFVTLKSFDKKKLLIPTLIITSLILVITIFVSHAEFTSTDHVTIVDGVINYTPYDFKMMAMYQQKEECLDPSIDTCYKEVEVMPSKDYYIDEEKSYCYKTNPEEKIYEKVYTNSNGEHIIKDLEKNTKCILYFGTRSFNTLSKLKLVSNGTTANFNGTSCIDETCTYQENGIYETEDDDGVSYYFRGTVENNYVKFGKDKSQADIWWRIIRINGDGSIRMIYAGTSTDGNAPAQTGEGTTIGNYAFNTLMGNNKYVGYQYTDGIRNGHDEDSNALIVLTKWFKENLIEEYNAGYIDDNAGFCNDRSAFDPNTHEPNNNLGTNHEPTIYGGNIRLALTGQPILYCPDKEHDLFTSTKSNQGTKSLEYPIALITIDEVLHAGNYFGGSNTKYYLYNNQTSWTMTPSMVGGTDGSMINYASAGYLGWYFINDLEAFRPVINLKANSLTVGKGTIDNPYKTN